MIATDSTGYSPEALSAESMTQSTPSITAVATSEASARVGIGESIIDSSICVATTTGLPALRQMRVISFCTPGIRSGGNSTPRSPRAIMTPSAAETISSRMSNAAGFSILIMMAALSLIRLRASMISLIRWTNESATQSTPRSSAKARSSLSFSVRGEISRLTSGTLTPLRSLIGPPTSTRVSIMPVSTPVTVNCRRPSFTSMRCPGRIASNISGCGRVTRSAVPFSSLRSKVKLCPFLRTVPSSISPIRSFGPCKSARMVIGLPVSSASSRIVRKRSAWSSCTPWLKLSRKADAPASIIARMVSRSLLDGPSVARIRVAVEEMLIKKFRYSFH